MPGAAGEVLKERTWRVSFARLAIAGIDCRIPLDGASLLGEYSQ